MCGKVRAIVDILLPTVLQPYRFFDCQHAIPAVATENLGDATVDSRVSVGTMDLGKAHCP